MKDFINKCTVISICAIVVLNFKDIFKFVIELFRVF